MPGRWPSQAVGGRRQAAQDGTTASGEWASRPPRVRAGAGRAEGQARAGEGKRAQDETGKGGARARSLIGQETTRPRGSQGRICPDPPRAQCRSVSSASTTHVARWQGDWVVTWVVRVSGPSGLLNYRSTTSPYPPPHPRSIRFAPRAELPSPIPLPQSFSLVFTFPNISLSSSCLLAVVTSHRILTPNCARFNSASSVRSHTSPAGSVPLQAKARIEQSESPPSLGRLRFSLSTKQGPLAPLTPAGPPTHSTLALPKTCILAPHRQLNKFPFALIHPSTPFSIHPSISSYRHLIHPPPPCHVAATSYHGIGRSILQLEQQR